MYMNMPTYYICMYVCKYTWVCVWAYVLFYELHLLITIRRLIEKRAGIVSGTVLDRRLCTVNISITPLGNIMKIIMMIMF